MLARTNARSGRMHISHYNRMHPGEESIALNEREALDVLLVHAIDTNTSGAPRVPAPLRDACSMAAARECSMPDDSSRFAAERFIVCRAGRLLDLAGSQAPEIVRLRALRAPRWAFPALMLVAFMVGIGSHALGDAHRINLLLAPMLAILVWNVLVYGVLAVSRFGSRDHGSIAASMARWHWHRAVGSQATAYQDVFKAWLSHAAPIIDARARCVFHTAAAALAIGAIAGMYGRGLGVEFLAGWESTFLNEHGARRILAAALSIGSFVTGIEIGDAAQMASLRFRNGTGGAPAGPWIHLYAATAAIVIVVPRLALAALAKRRARTLASRLPISLDDAYIRRLLRGIAQTSHRLLVVPVAITVNAYLRDALQSALEQQLGGRIDLIIGESVPYGGSIPAHGGDQDLVLVFAAAATPEPEVHGALIKAAAPVAVVIDETAMQQRFGTDATMTRRIEERREAWRAMLADARMEPVFIGSPSP